MVSQAVGGDQAGLVLGEAPDRQTRLTPTSQAISWVMRSVGPRPWGGQLPGVDSPTPFTETPPTSTASRRATAPAADHKRFGYRTRTPSQLEIYTGGYGQHCSQGCQLHRSKQPKSPVTLLAAVAPTLGLHQAGTRQKPPAAPSRGLWAL